MGESHGRTGMTTTSSSSSSSGYDLIDGGSGNCFSLCGEYDSAKECQRKMQRLCGILAAAIVAREGGVDVAPRAMLRSRSFLCVAFYCLHGRCFDGRIPKAGSRTGLASRGDGKVNDSYVALSSLVFQRMSAGISDATAAAATTPTSSSSSTSSSSNSSSQHMSPPHCIPLSSGRCCPHQQRSRRGATMGV